MRKRFLILAAVVLVQGCASYRPWTKAEKVAAGYFCAAHVTNMYSTMEHQSMPDQFIEANPALGEHPSNGTIVAYGSIAAAITLVWSHFHPDDRLKILVPYGLANTGFAYDDLKKVREAKK